MRRSLRLAVVLLCAEMVLRADPGSGIAVNAQGQVFVTVGAFVVMIDTNGQARTIVSDPKNEKFFQLHHIRRAPDGGMVTASDIGDAVWRFTAEGSLSRFYPGAHQAGALRVGSGGDPFEVDGLATVATFSEPTGVALGPGGEVYVLEVEKQRVRRISKDGRVITVGRVTPRPLP